MFKSLKEKLTSWFKKPEEPKKEVKKKKKKLGAKGITIDAVLTKKPELWST